MTMEIRHEIQEYVFYRPTRVWNKAKRSFSESSIIYPLGVFVFIVAIIFLVDIKVKYVLLGDELKYLKREAITQRDINRKTEARIMEAQSLSRIEAIAKEQFGMSYPTQKQRLNIVIEGVSDNTDIGTISTRELTLVSEIKYYIEKILIPEYDVIGDY